MQKKFFSPKAVITLSIVAAAIALVLFLNMRNAFAVQQFSGAIYTSLKDGTTVNQNLYDKCDEVYLNGGPQNQNGQGLPDGIYYFQVTTPNGDLLSTDNAECRKLQVIGGVVSGATGNCPHPNGDLNPANGSQSVLLFPFNPTTNAGGEYKVWLIMESKATIDADGIHLIFSNSDSKTDNFKCREKAGGVAIGGVKYYDTNANGTFDAGETGIQGVTISVNVGGNVITTETGTDGAWALVFPTGTTYTACEVLPADTTYTQTGPLSGATAPDKNGNTAATANANKCWVGTVAATDTTGLNFYNVVCTPKITCPADVTIECDAFTDPSNTGKATATDNCDADPKIDYTDSFAAGSCPKTGVITRTWTITDKFGKTDSCTQTITIVDSKAPVITGIGGETTIQCPATPIFSDPSASDNCSKATLTFADVTTPGSCSGTYSITRTWTAQDECGNSSKASQTINVIDTTPPTLNNDAGASGVIYCPTAPVFKAPTASDSCSTATVYVVSDTTTAGTCGTYSRTVTWGASDACGNESPVTRSQTIEVRCNTCGEGTMGFWQNKNGQDLIKGTDQTALKTYLTGFNPFKDLTTQVIASYVTTIIKSANASGSTMNAMLKAQMLSTALDVYFKKVLGTANIDLTYINKPIGSTTYEDVSSSFGGASCMSVNNMLIWAANQSNVGGSVWYGQVKSGPNSQELAKDAFDAINNQKAFSVLSCP